MNIDFNNYESYLENFRKRKYQTLEDFSLDELVQIATCLALERFSHRGIAMSLKDQYFNYKTEKIFSKYDAALKPSDIPFNYGSYSLKELFDIIELKDNYNHEFKKEREKYIEFYQQIEEQVFKNKTKSDFIQFLKTRWYEL